MTYTRTQLISALYEEHKFFAHDDCNLQDPDDYLQDISSLSHAELVSETDTDDAYDLELYMQDWLPA